MDWFTCTSQLYREHIQNKNQKGGAQPQRQLHGTSSTDITQNTRIEELHGVYKKLKYKWRAKKYGSKHNDA